MIPLFDAHLDLAWSAVAFNRDLTRSVDEIRAREKGMTDEPSRGRNTLTLPELRRAGVRVCVATLLARGGPNQKPQPGYKRTDLDHANPSIAYTAARAQLAYYELLEKQRHIILIRSVGDLDYIWKSAALDPTFPLGVILSMEGTDPIVTPEQSQEWWYAGLRAAGLAHYGQGQHAFGTGVTGPLSESGITLLHHFQRLKIILDVTHLCDESMAQALDLFDGPILASHHNCRALVPGDRQLTDEQIKRLIQRNAVIGTAFDAWMLYPNWQRGQTLPEVVGLDAAVDHIERICQIAGNARHAAIGSDLDGGFGTEQTPRDLDTITDLQKLVPILRSRGFSEADVNLIFHDNWLRLYRNALPN